MDALAGYGSEESEDEPPKQDLSNLILPTLTAYSDEEDDERPLAKSAAAIGEKLDAKGNLKSGYILPPPPLGMESIVMSDTDHFSATYATPIEEVVPMPPKLEELQSQSTTNWALKLKSQHEFHNPGFFQNVIQHVGIQDELGTNTFSQEQFQPYEYDLLKLEEEARMRQQQQHNPIAAPTAYAQQQLERAMRQHPSKSQTS